MHVFFSSWFNSSWLLIPGDYYCLPRDQIYWAEWDLLFRFLLSRRNLLWYTMKYFVLFRKSMSLWLSLLHKCILHSLPVLFSLFLHKPHRTFLCLLNACLFFLALGVISSSPATGEKVDNRSKVLYTFHPNCLKNFYQGKWWRHVQLFCFVVWFTFVYHNNVDFPYLPYLFYSLQEYTNCFFYCYYA